MESGTVKTVGSPEMLLFVYACGQPERPSALLPFRDSGDRMK